LIPHCAYAELPEVEAVVRTLRPLVQGRRIRCVHVFHPIATKPQAASHVARLAQGGTFAPLVGKGKYILLVLDRGLLTMHFRLDGQLLWFAHGKELLPRANQREMACTLMLLSNWTKAPSALPIAVISAAVHIWASADECPGLGTLGVDALSRDFNVQPSYRAACRVQASFEGFLAEPVGASPVLANIYSCESLWHARLDPRRTPTPCSRKKRVACTKQLCLFSRVP